MGSGQPGMGSRPARVARALATASARLPPSGESAACPQPRGRGGSGAPPGTRGPWTQCPLRPQGGSTARAARPRAGAPTRVGARPFEISPPPADASAVPARGSPAPGRSRLSGPLVSIYPSSPPNAGKRPSESPCAARAASAPPASRRGPRSLDAASPAPSPASNHPGRGLQECPTACLGSDPTRAGRAGAPRAAASGGPGGRGPPKRAALPRPRPQDKGDSWSVPLTPAARRAGARGGGGAAPVRPRCFAAAGEWRPPGSQGKTRASVSARLPWARRALPSPGPHGRAPSLRAGFPLRAPPPAGPRLPPRPH